jgi:hypothetical protein
MSPYSSRCYIVPFTAVRRGGRIYYSRVPDRKHRANDRYQQHRLVEPGEIARAVYFLAGMSSMTGSVLSVDGGVPLIPAGQNAADNSYRWTGGPGHLDRLSVAGCHARGCRVRNTVYLTADVLFTISESDTKLTKFGIMVRSRRAMGGQ